MSYVSYPVVKSEYDRVWKKYCGFLDLTVNQFMTIQETLLIQQLEKVISSPLGQRLINSASIRNAGEFRRNVPLTTYDDYLPELNLGIEEFLPEKPYTWSHTAGGSEIPKKVPYTLQSYQKSLDSLMTVFVLACSQRKGQSQLKEDDRVLFNVAPKPYLSGILATGASETLGLKPVMKPDEHDELDFKDKVARGFEMSLRHGVDILIAMTSVLVKTGNDFNRLSKKKNITRYMRHPGEFYRVMRAFIRSKIEKRRIMPRDLWPVKALVGWGIDTSIYREQVFRQWGAYPYEFHACTEAGIMAVQSWTRKSLTLIPHSNFYEFIPETEWYLNKKNPFYEPKTVLLSEVKPGERYELVITSFHGMPFVRYRLGHLIRVTDLIDDEAEIYLPQIVFETRADDLIDIAGFTRISEKIVTQALANMGIAYEDWCLRKEFNDGKPMLHLFLELFDDCQQANLASMFHSELMNVDHYYRDLVLMMEVHLPKVTVLPCGTFGSYYKRRKADGLMLAQRKPARMNPSDEVVADLIVGPEKQVVAVS